MAWQNFLENSGIVLAVRLAIAIVLSVFVVSLAYAEDISASCHEDCQDRDHDGYYRYDVYNCPSGTDLNDTNPNVHPNATEICNNRIDDDLDGKTDCLDSDCSAYLSNSTCFFRGNCSSSCTCAYSSQVCPESGTVINGTCYYGIAYANASCTTGGCVLNHSSMLGYDVCNETNGPQDITGPVILDVVVTPALNNGTFNISAAANDSHSPINATEYFLRTNNESQNCGAAGTGVKIYPADDGAFNNDNLTETVSSSVRFEHDGNNSVCLQAQDAAWNWGNCTCVNFEVDSLPPLEEGNLSLNNISGPFEELICNASPVLNLTFCDSLSDILLAEYFLDMSVTGYGLNILNHYLKNDGSHCSGFSGEINLSNLTEGVHTISGLSSRDALGNQGNYDIGANYSFVKDSAPPATSLVFSSNYETCNIAQANGKNISNCYFVLNASKASLNATDAAIQSSAKFLENITTNYLLWSSYNNADNWTLSGDGVYRKNQTFDIILENGAYYLYEYWSEDSCRFSEQHKFELVVVSVCGDGSCNFAENSDYCPADCLNIPTVSSSSSSGTGTSHYYGVGQWVPVNNYSSTMNESAILVCEPNLTCGEPSACMDGIMTQECVDLNNCTDGDTSQLILPCKETKPVEYCGDGICQRVIGENEQTCPLDCLTQESNAVESSPPTGNFLAAPGGLLSALILLLIVAIGGYLIYKRNKNLAKIKAKSIK